MSDYMNPKASERAVRSLAYKVLRRLHALGAKSATLDDVIQELWVGWCKTVETFDPEMGVQFSTYLHRGLRLHINRHIERNYERFHGQTIALSLDAELESSDRASIATLGDAIEDENAEDPEAAASRESCWNYAQTRLSDRAKFFVTVLREQPAAMLDEVQRLGDKSVYARDLGLPYAQPARLTSAMVFDLMQASRRERGSILKEVSQLGDLMTRR